MRLIDILNMISKGELKEGTKIKIKDGKEEFTYKKSPIDDENHHLYNEEGETIFENYYIDVVDEEVELIEPEEEIEELDKEEIMHLTLPSAIAVITDTLNKIIQKIKKGDKQ